ncbi:hypothetical protein PENSPDRAFT_645895 [Peniophora sp. CONT]|nr:hypothetical protein PENSPDRAFT_645895 [Peniophora sp. CONT]
MAMHRWRACNKATRALPSCGCPTVQNNQESCLAAAGTYTRPNSLPVQPSPRHLRLMPRIVISASSPSASASSPSSPAGSTRGSLRIRDNKTDIALSAATRALEIVDQLNDLVPSVPGLGLAASAARTLIDEAKSARRRRKDCEDLAEYASKALEDVSRRLVDRPEWPPQVEEKMRELARVFIETSTRVREIGAAKGWRTFVMRDAFDAIVEGQRMELANAFHTFNIALNLDTNVVARETQKDVRALLLNRDRDELGYLRIQTHDIKHIEVNPAGRTGWYSGATNVYMTGHGGVVLCKEYHDLQIWRDDLRILKKLRYARLPELLAYSAQADAPQLFIILKSVPRLGLHMWTMMTLAERTIVQNVHLYYHGLRTLRDAAKHVQQQFELTDEQLVGVLEGLTDADVMVAGDDSFLLTLPDIRRTAPAQCLWYLHKVGCPKDPSLCYPDPCAQFRYILHPIIRITLVIFPETGSFAHENRIMTRQRQFYDLIDKLFFALWERASIRFGFSFQQLVQTYMTKRADEMSLRELRRLAALGDMPWYQTEFTNVGWDNGVSHLAAGTYGWVPPHDTSHLHIRDMCCFLPLGHVQDIIPDLLTSRRENVDVAIRLSSWGEAYPKMNLITWRNSRSNRFRLTVTTRHKESVGLYPRENNFWSFLAEQGATLADRHRNEHPLIEPHDPVVVCCVENEFESELDVDLTDPQWNLVAPDCRFKPILDFLEHASLELAPDPRSEWLTTAVLGQLCGHMQASGISGPIAWHKDPEAKIDWDDCDCVLVPQDVDLAPPPPGSNVECRCDFCRESASKWTMKKTWVTKLDPEDYSKPS